MKIHGKRLGMPTGRFVLYRNLEGLPESLNEKPEDVKIDAFAVTVQALPFGWSDEFLALFPRPVAPPGKGPRPSLPGGGYGDPEPDLEDAKYVAECVVHNNLHRAKKIHDATIAGIEWETDRLTNKDAEYLAGIWAEICAVCGAGEVARWAQEIEVLGWVGDKEVSAQERAMFQDLWGLGEIPTPQETNGVEEQGSADDDALLRDADLQGSGRG